MPARPGSGQPPVALYVHIPYCVSICPYCDFVVVAGAASRGPRSSMSRFVEAVAAEIALRADGLDGTFGPAGAARRPPLASLYLGGGTPSLLPAPTIERLVGLVRRRFGLAHDAEITVELNPGPDERGDAGALRDAGVTRLSIGAQSFDDGELRRLGRRHRAIDVAAAAGEARAAGIASLSLDLLYDNPGQTEASWSATLDRVLALEPDHVSAYALTLDEPGADGIGGPLGDHLAPSPGARRWRAAARAAQDDDRAAAMYEVACERLAAAGFRGYEISNWARPGHESRHNLAYWRRLAHEAVGPGAHAFDGLVRRWNAAPLGAYLAALAPGDGGAARLPPGGSETVGGAAAAAEATILALRLDTGLSRAEAEAGPLAPHLGWALDAGLLRPARGPEGEDRVALTTRGRLLSNELFARLV
jgi:oxygen-independent coproporphyrinogen-3 oxidase